VWTLRTVVVALGRGACQVLSLSVSEACSEVRPWRGKAMAQVSGPHRLGRELKEDDLGRSEPLPGPSQMSSGVCSSQFWRPGAGATLPRVRKEA